ncbi:MAG: hypothetical protein FK732_10015 [Asgard group archaeon]|nr:hypothetical protein [Asgard group archaeon]
MIEELNEIHKQVLKDPINIPSDIKKRYWKLVGQIKRTPNPNKEIVAKASEIRELLYSHQYGPSIPSWIILPILLILAITCEYTFFYAVIYNLSGAIDGYKYWSIWWTMVFLYPFGRLTAGIFTKIKFDNFVLTPVFFPNLKVNYQSYLNTSPPKRQWFFLFCGLWSPIVTGILGITRYIVTVNLFSLHAFIIMFIVEIISATGVFGKWGGEMNNFHRERKIVHDWHNLLEKNSLNN